MSLTLPTIPPQPSATPPADLARVAVWQTEWANYRWAVEQHAQAECRAEQAATRAAFTAAGVSAVDGIERALSGPRAVGKADVVLACVRAVPATVGATELTHAQQVKRLADALWREMQADPAIKPPQAQA